MGKYAFITLCRFFIYGFVSENRDTFQIRSVLIGTHSRFEVSRSDTTCPNFQTRISSNHVPFVGFGTRRAWGRIQFHRFTASSTDHSLSKLTRIQKMLPSAHPFQEFRIEPKQQAHSNVFHYTVGSHLQFR